MSLNLSLFVVKKFKKKNHQYGFIYPRPLNENEDELRFLSI